MRRPALALASVVSIALLTPALARTDALTPARLIRMSKPELLCLYRSGTCRPVPEGFARGFPIFGPGERWSVPAGRLTRLLWQGKIFRDDGSIRNRILLAPVFKAGLGTGPSWYDGRPSVVMDYAGTSRLFGAVRDEVREVSPGMFLGLTYLRQDDAPPKLATLFVLDAR